jgi:electron-transferring-flavoprotein dehydrogenase
LISKFDLDKDSDPQCYGIGFKELWRLAPGKAKPGLVQHTIGWPLDSNTYGGSFVYHMDNDRVSIGFVCGLDYADPEFSPFEAFQQFKHHPSIKPLLDDGEIISSGARAIIEGGYQSLPRVEMPGALLVGDAAGLLNLPKIKGTHQAMNSGMLAAEHLAGSVSSNGFDARLRTSRIYAELKKVRNIRPGFYKGRLWGLINASWETVTLGRSPWTLKNHADHSGTSKLGEVRKKDPGYVGRQLPPRDRLAFILRLRSMMKTSRYIYRYCSLMSVSTVAGMSTATPAPGFVRPTSTR